MSENYEVAVYVYDFFLYSLRSGPYFNVLYSIIFGKVYLWGYSYIVKFKAISKYSSHINYVGGSPAMVNKNLYGFTGHFSTSSFSHHVKRCIEHTL